MRSSNRVTSRMNYNESSNSISKVNSNGIAKNTNSHPESIQQEYESLYEVKEENSCSYLLSA